MKRFLALLSALLIPALAFGAASSGVPPWAYTGTPADGQAWTYNQAGAYWTNSNGVTPTGPGTSTNNGIATWNGTIGASLFSTSTTLSSGNLAGLSTLGIGTGTTTAATGLQIVDTGTSNPRGITNDQYNTGTNSAQINLRKARGTFASPTTIVTGDVLSRLIAWGHDGSNFIESGNIRFMSSGTIAATRVPSQVEIWTSTNALPSVLTKAVTWDSSQNETLVGNLTVTGGTANVSNVTAAASTNLVLTGGSSGPGMTLGNSGATRNYAFATVSTSLAAWGTSGIGGTFGSGSTYTDSSTAGSGTAANAVFWSFAQPTLAASNTLVTTTDAATVYIANGPAAGTNQTLTNSWGLRNGGKSRLDGVVSLTANVSSTSTTTGSGTVTGGFGISQNLWVGGTGNFTGIVTLQAGLDFNHSNTISPISWTDTSGSHYNWNMGVNRTAFNVWEVTPSTTAGGSSFTTPALKIDANLANQATFTGVVAVGGATASASTALITPASTTAISSIRIPSGTAPTSPVSGDLWYDGTNLKFRDGSTTRTITWTP